MSNAAPKLATYEDVLGLPDNVVGQIIDGELHVQPRPAAPHAQVTSALGGDLEGPFRRGKGGPGGWIILDEPELHVGSDILVPDLAGWRRERLPELPDEAYFTLAPDWACEVLSPSTRALDRTKKLPIYQRESVTHVWLIDPAAKTLEAYRLDGESYRLVSTHADEQVVRVEPFDAIELELKWLWQR